MTDEHEPADDFAARVAQQFRETFTRDLATVMEAGIDEQNKRLTDIAERFERKDREMAMEQQDIVAKAEALLANVTPGPWEWWVEDGEYRRLLSGSADVLRINAWSDPLTIETEAADAAFIATAPELVRELLAEVKRLRASERADTPPMEFEVPTDMKWPPSPPNNYNPVIFAFNPQPEPVKAEVYVWQAEQDILRAALLRNATVSVDSECEDIKVSPRAQGGWQYSHTWRCFEGVPDDTYYEDYAPEYIERLIDKLIGDGWPDAFKITESEDAK
jgi:hypothetical protein